jgi:UDP-glucose 4-epimerase
LRVLVTGGAGFIGSNLVDRLLAEGHRVDVVDDLSTGSLANLADARRSPSGHLTFHQLDVRAPRMADLVQRARPRVVFHLAAVGGPVPSTADPVTDAETNLMGSLRVMEAARRSGVQKVVFSSGAAVYGQVDPVDLPVKESHRQRPASPHGAAKKAVGDYLDVYRELHTLEFTVLVLADVYGPRRESGVVAAFARQLVAGQPGTIAGDGGQTRDFVFVDDVVDALARAGQRGGGLLINVGTGIETSVLELYETMARMAGSTSRPVHAPARPGELHRAALDPGRAAIHLGWKPWTTLADGTGAVLASMSPGTGDARTSPDRTSPDRTSPPAKGRRGSGQRNKSSR